MPAKEVNMSKEGKEELMNQDQRLLNRKLLQGEISEKEIQGLLKKLPDVSENAEEINLEEDRK
jgi:hypothetical protein